MAHPSMQDLLRARYGHPARGVKQHHWAEVARNIAASQHGHLHRRRKRVIFSRSGCRAVTAEEPPATESLRATKDFLLCADFVAKVLEGVLVWRRSDYAPNMIPTGVSVEERDSRRGHNQDQEFYSVNGALDLAHALTDFYNKICQLQKCIAVPADTRVHRSIALRS